MVILDLPRFRVGSRGRHPKHRARRVERCRAIARYEVRGDCVQDRGPSLRIEGLARQRRDPACEHGKLGMLLDRGVTQRGEPPLIDRDLAGTGLRGRRDAAHDPGTPDHHSAPQPPAKIVIPFAIAFRILITFAYNHAAYAVLVAAITHASFNEAPELIAPNVQGTLAQVLAFASTALLALLAGVVSKGTLGYHREHRKVDSERP